MSDQTFRVVHRYPVTKWHEEVLFETGDGAEAEVWLRDWEKDNLGVASSHYYPPRVEGRHPSHDWDDEKSGRCTVCKLSDDDSFEARLPCGFNMTVTFTEFLEQWRRINRVGDEPASDQKPTPADDDNDNVALAMHPYAAMYFGYIG